MEASLAAGTGWADAMGAITTRANTAAMDDRKANAAHDFGTLLCIVSPCPASEVSRYGLGFKARIYQMLPPHAQRKPRRRFVCGGVPPRTHAWSSNSRQHPHCDRRRLERSAQP